MTEGHLTLDRAVRESLTDFCTDHSKLEERSFPGRVNLANENGVYCAF